MIEIIKTWTTQNDAEEMEFLEDFQKRQESGNWVSYLNGKSVCEISLEDGTHIRSIFEEDGIYRPENLECADVHLSDKCEVGCKFCYANCTRDGKVADIERFISSPWFQSLKPGMEMACNLNEFKGNIDHLEKLLDACKEKGILANVTVEQRTYMKNKEVLHCFQIEGKLFGIGVSVKVIDEYLLKDLEECRNVVAHTITGITPVTGYQKLIANKVKILILGYKDIGRGTQFKVEDESNKIEMNRLALKRYIKFLLDTKVSCLLSFDNLAIDQLGIKDMISEENYGKFFRGEEATCTYFVNAVSMQYALNSLDSENLKSIENKTSQEILKLVRREGGHE